MLSSDVTRYFSARFSLSLSYAQCQWRYEYSSAHARYTKIVCYNSKDAQKINHTGNNDVNMSQGNVCPKVSQKRNSYTVCHEEETQFGEIEYFLCVSVFGSFKV